MNNIKCQVRNDSDDEVDDERDLGNHTTKASF